MKEKEIAIIPPGLSPEQIELVKRTVARGATNDELALFLYTAKRTGLDPLTKQVHFIKRKNWSKAANNGRGGYIEVGTTQTGIDGYRSIAARTNELAGIDDAVFDSEDGINPKKASVTVYRMVGGEARAFTATARWLEYVATDRDGNPTAMWKKMPYLMIGKCAEALALRKAFPSELSGLYTNEEMSQADAPKIYPAEFAQTPVADDAKVVSTGDDFGGGDKVIQLDEDGYIVKEEVTPTPEDSVIHEAVLNGELVCSDTGKKITQAEYDYSLKLWGRPLSRTSQKKFPKLK